MGTTFFFLLLLLYKQKYHKDISRKNVSKVGLNKYHECLTT